MAESLWAVQYLEIEGERQKDLYRFTIRWTNTDDMPIPVLYCDGKRVTKAWRLTLRVEAGPDEYGGNANTA